MYTHHISHGVRRDVYIGEVLFGKYKVISLLGKGGFSRVVLARHMYLDSLRAIKVISKGCFLHDRLVNEACILKNINHECIPTIYDIEEDDENSYIIEEYCKGVSLYEERNSWEGSDYSKIIDYSIQICSLIEYLHEGGRKILYLDLKPENLIVSNGRIMLVDFGTAVSEYEVEDMNFCMGTRGFAAPEQYDVNKRPDIRSDIYGIGGIIRFLKYGGHREVSAASSNRRHRKKTKDEIDRIIDKCLKENPNDRYSCAGEIINELSHAASHRRTDVMKKIINGNHGKKEWHNKNIMVAVAGTFAGAGSTFLTMLLARYYGEYLKKNTIVVDVSRNMDITNMLKPDIKKGGIRNISYIGGKSEGIDYKGLFRDGQDVVIADFGEIRPDRIDSFCQFDVNYIATSVDEWKIAGLLEFYDRYQGFDPEKRWIYTVSGCSVNVVKNAKKIYGIRLEHIGTADFHDEIPQQMICLFDKVTEKILYGGKK